MITILHPTVRMIMSKYSFIHNLIALYPDFYKSWENDYESKMREIIDQIAEGDPIIKASMHEYSPISENEEEMMNMFYQAMAIEVYAFYATSLLYIHKQEGIPGVDFRTLKEERKIQLSPKAQQENEFVYNCFRVFRNYIAHNVDSEPEDDHRAVLSELAKSEKGISYDDDSLMITDDSFLLKALDSGYLVLRELCEELGYKSTTIGEA